VWFQNDQLSLWAMSEKFLRQRRQGSVPGINDKAFCFDLESGNVKNCEFTGLTYSPSFSEAAARARL